MLRPGQIIDRYTVEAHLGTGGMAEVYRVRHKTTQGLHALKLLRSGSPQVRRRLLQEARVQAAMRHPSVVAVTDVVDVDGVPGLVMDYVDGPTLLDWLDKDHPDLQTRLTVFRAVLRGIGRAHQLGVVHRDLSPHNVLIERSPDGVHPRITDFGIAKVLDPDQAGPDKTRAGHPMGTPAFMAPEQVRDASDVDQRADIWALGSLLYLLVTDRLAFDGADVLEVFNKIAQADYDSPPADLPPGVLDAIRGCLRVDRAARLQTCAAVASALDQGSVPLSVAAPAAPVERPARPRRPLAVAILAVVALAVVALAGAGASAWLAVEDVTPTTATSSIAADSTAPPQIAEVETPATQPAGESAGDSTGERAAANAPAADAPAVDAPAADAPAADAPAADAPAVDAPAVDAPLVGASSQDQPTPGEEAPAAGPPAQEDARWTLAGPFKNVWLESSAGGGKLQPGPVSPGTYTVKLSGMVKGQVDITAGSSVTITCTNTAGHLGCVADP